MNRFCSMLSIGVFLTAVAISQSCGSDPSDGIKPLDLNFEVADTGADLPQADVLGETESDLVGDGQTGEIQADLVPEQMDPPDEVTGPLCVPGQRKCMNAFQPAQCDETGMLWVELNKCSEGYSCYAESGSCAKKVCQPASRECVDSSSYHICKIDGSGWEETVTCEAPSVCGNGLCIAPGCLPKVMFLVDRSSSMGSNWDSVRNSVQAVALQNPGVQFGLTVFPSEGGFFAGCTMDPDAPHIPIQANAAPLLDDWFEENDPAGATPLLTAIKWIDSNVNQIWGAAPENAYLVLLSDGEDKCACSQYENDADKRAECVAEKLEPVIQSITQKGVKTFVIGYAYSGPDIELAVIAENGGTTQTDWIYAGDEATLTQAFGKLIDDIKWCM